jgi:hypothetical protein
VCPLLLSDASAWRATAWLKLPEEG